MKDDGQVIGARGKPLSIKLRGTQRYPTFAFQSKFGVYGIPVHQFAAYVFFGDKPKGMVVRHLNGNTLDNSKKNLKYGTHSENNLDKPEKDRIAAAKKARASQSERHCMVLSEEQEREIGEAYLPYINKKCTPNGFSKKLSKKYLVDRNTITRYANRWLKNNGYK